MTKKKRVGCIGFCDYGHSPVAVKRLSIGGGAGVFLCRKHWAKEMRWRKSRNRSLRALRTGTQFRILKW